MDIIARPYAKALFELATETKQLTFWRQVLTVFQCVAKQPKSKQIIDNPTLTKAQKSEWFLFAAKAVLKEEEQSTEVVNLIELLAENDRLAVLPNIAQLYVDYEAKSLGVLQAQVDSAFALDAASEEAISAMLARKYGCQMVLQCRVNPKLIGGVLIRVGDEVIDGSIRGQLKRLSSELAH